MNQISFRKSAFLAVFLVVAFVAGWEGYWRSQNYELAFNDDESLWSYYRSQVYESSPARPVVIGSSRIKFDLDQNTWEQITGKKPIQLSLVGTSPRPLLTDLGNDPNFRGILLVDVTEPLFFTPDGAFPEKQATRRVKAYPNWSLSQQISFRMNRVLESNLLFLDEEGLSLPALISRLPIQDRPGVWPGPRFPLAWSLNRFDRQTAMTRAFLRDTVMQNQVKAVWNDVREHSPKQAVDGPLLEAILNSVKKSVDQIRTRGGQVVFIRTPSDGPMNIGENLGFPRSKYWDRLLSHTGCRGIYFSDYPELSRFRCPEWSHLTPRDAIPFTRSLIPILEQKTGWKIARHSATPPLVSSTL
ncbi:hypothetical protein [Larkinella soli]|uniref:hypothetical protein n=1 Tax=Larkinella soli TaxID=1770527 RepID=UPI000FFBA2CC|nr:hypothetical protein [Larkinella soli]